MPNALRHEIEVAEDSATLYLTGELCAADAFALSAACSELPTRVHTLRLDLHGVTHMQDDAMGAVRSVLRYWRESRLMKLAPVSQEMVLNYVAEHVLGLPRSY